MNDNNIARAPFPLNADWEPWPDEDLEAESMDSQTSAIYLEIVNANYGGASCESLLELFATDDCSRAAWLEPWLSFQLDELRGASLGSGNLTPADQINRLKREARNAFFLLARERQLVRPTDEPLLCWALQRYDLFLEALFLENEELLDGMFEGLAPDEFSENCDEYCVAFLFNPLLLLREYFGGTEELLLSSSDDTSYALLRKAGLCRSVLLD